MKEKRYKIKVSRGTIGFYNLKEYKEDLKNNEGWEGYIEFIPKSSETEISNGALRIYRQWIDIINTYTADSFESTDFFLRNLFANYQVVNKQEKKIIKVVKGLEEMDFPEFVKYMDCIFLWANEIMDFKNIELPLPCFMK